MAIKEEKIAKRRLRSSYFTTIVSMSLVLFLLGIIGLLLLTQKKVSEHIKNNIVVSMYIFDNAKEIDIIRLQKKLDATHYVKSTKLTSKEEAAEIYIKETGEDFVKFLGHNPLLANIDIRLIEEYANNDSIASIAANFKKYAPVKEVIYQKRLISKINENIKKISFFILIFSGVLFLISFTLINNTIRLSVYSKRFIINSMKLVGAKKSFIRRPFILKGIMHSVLGAIIATGLLIGLLYLIEKQISGAISIQDINLIGILFISIILIGIIISWVSTFFAVNKYLRIKTDNLYY